MTGEKAEGALWRVQVFYDGDCPLCRREIQLMRRLDWRDRIRFTDIAGEDFQPERWGKSSAELMAEIHGRLPDGRWITGVEVFRQLYGALGFAFLMPLTRLPGLRQALDAAYRIFARNRLKWTGRCRDGRCKIPSRSEAT